MTLAENISRTPRYRQNGLWPDADKLLVCALPDTWRHAIDKVTDICPNARIAAVCLPDGSKGNGCPLPVISPSSLSDFPECDIVIYWHQSIVPEVLYHLKAGQFSPIIFPRVPRNSLGRRHAPDLLSLRRIELESIYDNFADDESRQSFASVIKSLITGEIEWIRQSEFTEYEYPATIAKPGDVILDAGLFDSVVLRRFALATGETGHVHGFEPEPANYKNVCDTLRKYGDPGNITLVQKGVWSEKGEMHISDAGSSGSLGEIGSPCETIDIDSYVSESGTEKVDLIKMDIEGAEKEALWGARETIRRFNPKLHVCAYHHLDDIWEIPILMEKISRAYRLHFAAHVPYMNEYVYYFEPKGKAQC